MVDVEVLRNKVLDIAIQGNLATNDANEEAPEMPNVDDIVDEEDKQFEIPSNWRWSKIGWVMDIERGGSPRPIKAFLTDAKDGINWIKIGDVEKNGKYIQYTKEKIKPEGEAKSKRVYPGDFLLTNSMSFGRPYISQIQGCVHDGWLILRNTKKLFYYDFLYYLLSSQYMYNQFCKKASGATVDNLNIDKVAAAVVPIPPIDEQMRIVKQIEKVFECILIINETQSKYVHDIDVLKSKLIDAGIQGKLTEQLSEDGTAERLDDVEHVDLITDEDKILDIPDNWSWIRLGWAVEIERGGSPRPIKAFITDTEAGINWIKIGDVEKDGKYIFRTKEKIKLEGAHKSRKVYPGDFLLTNSMSFGRPYISKIEGAYMMDGFF